MADDDAFSKNGFGYKLFATEVEKGKTVYLRQEFADIRNQKQKEISSKICLNYDGFKNIMEKILQTEISCRYSHQTHFTSNHRRSQNTRNSEGFCEDNLPLHMSEQNRHGRGKTGPASSSDTYPSRAGR